MKAAIISSLFALSTLVSSSPVIRVEGTKVTARNATATEPPVYSTTETIYPDLQVRWKSEDPKTLARHTPVGHLMWTDTKRVHTAVHFDLKGIEGKTCKLVFRMSQNDWAINAYGGPAKFNLYRMNNCLNDDYSWESMPAPGALAGILTPAKGSTAAWEKVDMSADTMTPSMGAAPTFSCGAGEYSFVMVPEAGANIGWTSSFGKLSSGLSIEVCG